MPAAASAHARMLVPSFPCSCSCLTHQVIALTHVLLIPHCFITRQCYVGSDRHMSKSNDLMSESWAWVRPWAWACAWERWHKLRAWAETGAGSEPAPSGSHSRSWSRSDGVSVTPCMDLMSSSSCIGPTPLFSHKTVLCGVRPAHRAFFSVCRC